MKKMLYYISSVTISLWLVGKTEDIHTIVTAIIFVVGLGLIIIINQLENIIKLLKKE